MKIEISMVAFLLFVSIEVHAQKPSIYPEAPERWSKPEPIFSKVILDSFDRAEKPTVTADGKTLYFGSIWKTQLTDTGWSMPKYLPKRIADPNYAGADHPIISPNGKRLFFDWFVGSWFAYYCDWDSSINDWGPVQDAGYAINYSPNPEVSPGATPGCFLDDTTLIVLKGGYNEGYITHWHSATATWDTAVPWGFGTESGIAVTPDRKKVYTCTLRNDTTRDGKYYSNFDLLVSYYDTTYWRYNILNISLMSDSLYFAGVDSGRYEGFPAITADGKTLFFEADYQGKYTIYESHLVVDENGDSVTNAVVSFAPVPPTGFCLFPPYPNPFNPATTIRYSLPVRSNIKLIVYDILGRQIRILKQGIEAPGEHQITFDSTGLSSGTYFLLLKTPEKILTSKVMLIK